MISFFSKDVSFCLNAKLKHKKWLKQLAESEKKVLGDLNYIFCTDEYLLTLNQKYLSHDTYTDIITFDYSEQPIIAGDIFISIDRLKENAVQFEVQFEDEVLRVMAHGVLHLCGYKDKEEIHKKEMTAKENKYINTYKELL